jgi:hypothetical protein
MKSDEVSLVTEQECKKRALLLEHDSTVRLENNDESFTYKLALILPDNNLVCKSIRRAIGEGFAVGSLINLVSPIDNGSCVTPVQITAIGYQAELVALKVMGKSQHIQRRMFARIKTGDGVQLKLQLDNHTSHYKSLEVSDLSVGGVGVVIYSKNPITTGHYAKLDIQLPVAGSNNRVTARGQIVHCSPKSQNRMAFILGIRFTDLAEGDQRKIIEYIADLYEKDDTKNSHTRLDYEPEDQNIDKDEDGTFPQVAV